MGKRMRRFCNWLADVVEEAAERVVTWLRTKGQRPARPRPLAFPSKNELLLAEMLTTSLRALATRLLDDPSEPRSLLHRPLILRIPAEPPYVDRYGKD